MMPSKTTIAADEPVLIIFDTADRCDRCGAGAHSVMKTTPPLYFCMHHRIEYGDALMSSGFEIVDDQLVIDQLTENGKK